MWYWRNVRYVGDQVIYNFINNNNRQQDKNPTSGFSVAFDTKTVQEKVDKPRHGFEVDGFDLDIEVVPDGQVERPAILVHAVQCALDRK